MRLNDRRRLLSYDDLEDRIDHLEELVDFLLDLAGCCPPPPPSPPVPVAFSTTIPGAERNPSNMALFKIPDDNKTLACKVTAFRDAAGLVLVDPVPASIAWTSANPAVIAVDASTGILSGIAPITLATAVQITSTATLADGTVLIGDVIECELAAGKPAAFATTVA